MGRGRLEGPYGAVPGPQRPRWGETERMELSPTTRRRQFSSAIAPPAKTIQTIMALFRVSLDRTPGEIESLEASYSSFWARVLRASLEPWERYGAVESSPEMFGVYPVITDQFDLPDYLTKEEYLRGLGSVFASASADRSLVVHGHGAIALTHASRPAFHVLVEMGMDGRVRNAQLEEKVSESYARLMLQRSNRAFVSLYKNLYGVDPTKPAKYDIVINMDRLAVESAARLVSGAVTRSLKTYRMVQPQLQPA